MHFVVDANVDAVAIVQSVDAGGADVVVNRNVDEVGCRRCRCRCSCQVLEQEEDRMHPDPRQASSPDNPPPPTKLLFLSFRLVYGIHNPPDPESRIRAGQITHQHFSSLQDPQSTDSITYQL